VAEHAFAGVVVVAKRLVQTMAHLAGNHGGRNELRMRMLQAGARIGAVVFKNSDVVDALIGAK
jgi:hypothetical protein